MIQRIVQASALALLLAFSAIDFARAQSAQELIGETATAMGGMAALRAVKSQAIESEGKQFDSSSTPNTVGPTRQISTFRYTLTRDLTRPRLRLEWDGRNSARNENLRFVEVIDGSVGLLQEGDAKTGKQSRLHPGRLATRLREEKRSPGSLILLANANKSLKRLSDANIDGNPCRVVSFKDSGDEFHLYLDAKTKMPAQVDILEDDPLEGDSSYLLRYADWRRTENIMTPFSLRYELNGRALQEEQVKSVRHNAPLGADIFSIPSPSAVRRPTPSRSRRSGYFAE